MSRILKAIAETLFPENFICDICGRESFTGNLCEKCKPTVIFNDGTRCPVCGRRYIANEICTECKRDLPSFKKAVSPLVFENGTIELIHKFKNGASYLYSYFSRLILKSISDLPEPDIITYVPMTFKSELKRGYNQAKLLAKCVAKEMNIPCRDILIKKAETAEQKSLTKQERKLLLSGSFKVSEKSEVFKKRILLIDDVLTTGATANEACKALLKGGASEVYVATAASVEDKSIKNLPF